MQHVNIKIFAVEASADVRFADAIPVFHRWIQSRDLPELLIDVADYSHVPAGPGVVLIGHEANYALDNAENQPGLLYSRKAATSAPDVESLREAYESALRAAHRLAAEPEFQGKLEFDPARIEVTLNDRLLYPNTDEGWASVEPAFRAFFDGLLGPASYTLTRSPAPRERLRAQVGRTSTSARGLQTPQD